MQTRTHHLLSCHVEIITDIGMAQASNSIGANAFYVSFGQVINRSHIRYLSSFHFQGQSHHFLDKEFSDVDKLIHLLESQWHSHVVLYHQHRLDPNKELVVLEIKMKNSSEPVNALQDLDKNEISEMHNFSQQNCDVVLQVIISSINDWCCLGDRS